MARQNSLRVLEDYELDHVSGGLDEDYSEFTATGIEVPEGFNYENISGVYLIHDAVTDVWTAEFVFESNFTESGYSSSTYEDTGGGIRPKMPDDFGGGLQAPRQGRTTTTVTQTRSTGGWSIRIYIPGFIDYTYRSSSTTTTTTTTTTTNNRVTRTGAQGSLPPR